MNQPRGFRPSTVGNPSFSRRQRPRRLGPLMATYSRTERQGFMGDDRARQPVGGRAGTCRCRLARHAVHEGVVVAGIVMEDGKRADTRGVGDPHAFLPGRMTPALVPGILGIGVARIVDDDVGAAAKLDDGVVEAVALLLGVGDVADRLAAVLDAVAGGSLRM